MKNKKIFTLLMTTFLGVGVFTTAFALGMNVYTLGAESGDNSKTLILDSANAPTDFVDGKATIHPAGYEAATFDYDNAQAYADGHVTLLDGGTIKKDKAAGLQSILVDFAGGNLSVNSGCEANDLDHTYDLTSNVTTNIVGNYFEIVSDGTTNINSITVVYSCLTEVNLDSLEITKAPKITEYYAGETFDPTGMEVKACYSNGVKEVITAYTYPTEALVAGATTAQISYKGKSVNQTIKVIKDDLNINADGTFYVEAENLYQRYWVIQSGREGMQIETDASAHGGKFVGSLTVQTKLQFKFTLDATYDVTITGLMAKYEEDYSLPNSAVATLDGVSVTVPDVKFGHTAEKLYNNFKEVAFDKVKLEAGTHTFEIYFDRGMGTNTDCFKIQAVKDIYQRVQAPAPNNNGNLIRFNGNNYLELDRTGTTAFAAYVQYLKVYVYSSTSASKDAPLGTFKWIFDGSGKFASNDNVKTCNISGPKTNMFIAWYGLNNDAEPFEDIIAYACGNNLVGVSKLCFAFQVIADPTYVESETTIYTDSEISAITDPGYSITVNEQTCAVPQSGAKPFYISGGYIEIDRNHGGNTLWTTLTKQVRVYFYNSATANPETDALCYLTMESTSGNPPASIPNSGKIFTSDNSMSLNLNGPSGNMYINGDQTGVLQNMIQHECGQSIDLKANGYVSLKVIAAETMVRSGHKVFTVAHSSGFSILFKY